MVSWYIFVFWYQSVCVSSSNVLCPETHTPFFCFHDCQVSLFALSFWSFHFASLCAFGLLAYVGYIIYAFPSLFRLHRLNGLLLVFILLWAVSTYIFNVAFSFLNTKAGKVIYYLCANFNYFARIPRLEGLYLRYVL